MTSLIVETTDATFENDVLQSPLPVLLDFWAPWCGPCKAIAPMLERIATQYEGRLRVVKYDVDQNKDSWKRFNIRGVPTLITYRAGEEFGRLTGGSPSGVKLLLDTLLAGSEAQVDPGTNTFGNDPARKARCIARIEQAIADGRLGGQQQERSCDNLPSTIASGQMPDGEVLDALGLPVLINALYNHLCEGLSTNTSGTQFAADFLHSVPFGVDLSAVPRDYLLWILNDALGKLPVESEATPLLAELIELHRPHANSDVVTPARWETLLACIEEKLSVTDEQKSPILAAIAPLARPVTSIPAAAFVSLIDTTSSLFKSDVPSPLWTVEETERFNSAMDAAKSMTPLIAAIGPRPEETEALAAYEGKRRQIITDGMAKIEAICPTFQEQARLRHEETVRNALTPHAQYLLSRVASA
jgi:thioredoxin